MLLYFVIKQIVELGGEVAELRRDAALQIAQLQLLAISLLVKRDVACAAEVIVQLHAHITSAMLGEHHIAVAVDVLGIVEP